MPLTKKGKKIRARMIAQYGKEKGEQVFYASENAGTIEGVHGQQKKHREKYPEGSAALALARRTAKTRKKYLGVPSTHATKQEKIELEQFDEAMAALRGGQRKREKKRTTRVRAK